MEEENEPPSSAVEFIEAEIEAAGMDAPAAEVEVRDAIGKLPGIDRLDLSKGRISVRYDPTRTSEKHIEEAIAGAGHQIEKREISREAGHPGCATEGAPGQSISRQQFRDS